MNNVPIGSKVRVDIVAASLRLKRLLGVDTERRM